MRARTFAKEIPLFALAAIVAMACVRPPIVAASDDGDWSQILASGAVPGRYGHTAIYDRNRDRIVIFGGLTSAGNDSSVWALTLSGSPTWTQITPSGSLPRARRDHTAIYDPVRDRMIVFGGAGPGGPWNDVWVLNFSGSPVWTELTPSGGPPVGRDSHTAIYDPVRDRMVIFSGAALTFKPSDVRALSLSGSPVWTQLAPSGTAPTGREGHTAIYDPVRDRMVMVGGYDTAYRNDVWSLTLSGSPAWTKLNPSFSPPVGRAKHSAIYDSVRDRMVLFAGVEGQFQYHDDSWRLVLAGGTAWSALIPSGSPPPSRAHHTAVYDSRRDRMVVFSGVVGFSNPNPADVWALTWGQSVDVPTAGTGAHRMLIHAARPNRVHATAEIRYELPRDEVVRIDVLDIQGRVRRQLRNGFQVAGGHSADFDRRDDAGRALPAGMYLIQLSSRAASSTTRVVVLP